MKYPPSHHQEYNFHHVLETIRLFPLATLLSTEKGDIYSTHIPLIYQKGIGTLGKLIGHMDKLNPQCAHLEGKDFQLIFHGPNTYISPSILSTKQLPTWNYIKVHIKAKAVVNNGVDFLKKSLVNMTALLEQSDFRLSENDERMGYLIPHIVGFEMIIKSWEGKFKLSQDKKKEDQILAMKHMQEISGTHLNNYIKKMHNQ